MLLTWIQTSLLWTSLVAAGPWPYAPQEELGWGHLNTTLYFHNPPDPVNVRTLNFFYPTTHSKMPCYVPIEIRAAYNSYASQESIFGKKWTFNHNIRIRNAITEFEVLEGDGFINSYTREKNLEEARQALAQQVLVALKKEDAKKKQLKDEKHYKEIEKRLLEDKAFREESAKKYVTTARPLGAGEYFSLSRGQSKLVKKPDNSFVREFNNGSKEIFNSSGRLVRSEDRNGNHLTYVYQGDDLIKISDMCGRSTQFQYQTNPKLKGLVRTISDSLNRTWTYNFDDARNLVSYTGPGNSLVEYRYDAKGLMLSMRSTAKPGDNFKVEYNEKQEVTQQTGPGPERTEYKRSFVGKNPNHSITEITKFNGNQFVARELHEFKVGEFEVVTKFDSSGNEKSRKTKKLSAETGYPVSVLDARGNGELYRYDPETGNLLYRETVPAKETMTFVYDPKCNQPSSVEAKKPSGEVKTTTYTFDLKCNVTQALEKTGKKQTGLIQVGYNDKGRPSYLNDQTGNQQIAFQYWQYGKPESITLRDTGTLLVRYKPGGEINKVEVFPHGEGKKRFGSQKQSEFQPVILREVRAALDGILAYLRPAGVNIGL